MNRTDASENYMVYNARDLLTALVGDANAWIELSEPAKLIAVVQPLAVAARILRDESMLQQFRLVAVLHGVEHDVPPHVADDEPVMETPLPMQQAVPMLREAGQARDGTRFMGLGLSTSDLTALARCAHLLGSAALALGRPRLCRVYVMAARAIVGDGAARDGVAACRLPQDLSDQ